MLNDFIINDLEWAQQLERGLSDYLSTLWDNFYEEEDSDEYNDVTESGIYFCGNDCCVTRETLVWVTPRIIKGYLENKIELTGETK